MTSRFVRFNGVGLLGFVLQIAVLALLLKAHVQYLAATALAVEAALLHNFLWHERWTWIDRPAAGRARLERLWRFHVLNGVVSLVGNLLLMRLLVGVLGFPSLPSNAAAVLVCAAINFTASDRVVFEVRRPKVRGPTSEMRGCYAFAILVAERNASAAKVSVAFVQPPVGSVGEPATNRFS